MPARKLPAKRDDAMAELAELLKAMAPPELEAFALQLRREDRQLLERVMADTTAIGWRADPASMAAHLDPSYVLRPHVRYLSRKFVDLTNGKSKRQIWNIAGRYGKTSVIRWGLVWLLDLHPEAQSIFTSYGDKLADETGAAVMDTLRLHSSELRVRLKRDRQERSRFLTDQGGGLLTAGINATITGYGVSKGGILALDDPYKNWAEAHSEARRLHVANQVRGTLRNRLDSEDAGFLIVHHRMHHKDLTADLRKQMEDETGEPWEVVSLPSLAVENDPLGREVGEPLAPDLFPLEAVRSRAIALGSYLAAALEQQDPVPEEGNELMRGWFHLVDPGEIPDRFDNLLSSWDLKMKDKEAGDYVVGQVWGRTGSDFWLVDQIRGQYDHATTANAIALLAVRNPAVQQHVVEAAGSHDTVLPELRRPRPDYEVSLEMAGRLGMTVAEAAAVQAIRRRGMPGLIAHPVTAGSKPVRARTFIAPAAEAGNIHIVLASWTPHLLDEFASFGGAGSANDDQVDAASQALQRLGVGTASITPARRPAAPPAVAPQATAPSVRRVGAQVVLPRTRPRPRR